MGTQFAAPKIGALCCRTVRTVQSKADPTV